MAMLRNTIGRYWLWIIVTAVALVIFGALVYLLGVRPPKEFTIATGREGGAYYAYAQEYQRQLAELGYTLNIRETAGAIETIELLESGAVDVGFVQNTAIGSTPSSPLATLGALFYEALWTSTAMIWSSTRAACPNWPDCASTSAKRAVPAARPFWACWASNGINNQNATLTHLPAAEAAQHLQDGELDVMMVFLGAQSPLVTELLTTPGISLAPVRRAGAYATRYKNLVEVELPEGVFDFAADIPPADVPLLATRATLVTGPTLHPDLARLLLIIAAELHKQGGIFEEPGEFPAATPVGIPMNADAARYLESGPTMLENYLPLWLASRLERLFLLLLPIALIAYPLIRGTMSLGTVYYRDRIKWRYRTLRTIDREYKTYDRAQLEAAIAALAQEQDTLASDINVPTNMLDEVYNLHYHASLVLDRLNARLAVLESES